MMTLLAPLLMKEAAILAAWKTVHCTNRSVRRLLLVQARNTKVVEVGTAEIDYFLNQKDVTMLQYVVSVVVAEVCQLLVHCYRQPEEEEEELLFSANSQQVPLVYYQTD